MINTAVVLYLLLWSGFASAFEAKLEYRVSPSLGAWVELAIEHGESFKLMYGILLPASQNKEGENPAHLNVSVRIYGPDKKQVFPIRTQTCDVNYAWYGGCENISVPDKGITKILIFYSQRTIDELSAKGVREMLVILRENGKEGITLYKILLPKLVQEIQKLKV